MIATHLIEEGAASMHLGRRESVDVIVIGGGQAGLSVGYYLARAGVRFVILDANERIGDSWRNRWDSLRLFTPARFDGLDGMAFPARRHDFPTKDEMADYLEAYASRFRLPVRNGMRVTRLFKEGSRFIVQAGSRELEATQVVVAMAKYQRPQVPDFATSLSSEIVQLHSADYRNPTQLAPGGVVLVGGGNSGADIGLELARAGHQTWLAGRDNGQIPIRPEGFLGRHLVVPFLIGFVFHHILTVKTPFGRKARQAVLTKGGPLIRVKRADLAAAGIVRVPKVVGVCEGLPLLEDGRCLPVSNVLWCTGFHAGFDWLELPIFDERGIPRHVSGVVPGEPGLYFVGLPFLHAMSSSMVHGVGRDAARIVAAIIQAIGATRSTSAPAELRPTTSRSAASS